MSICNYSPLIFDKDTNIHPERKTTPSTNNTRDTGCPGRRIKIEPYFSNCGEINSKQTKDSNVKLQSPKLLALENMVHIHTQWDSVQL